MTKPLRTHLRAIGLMSGTSMDGIDVAMITTDGEAAVSRGASTQFVYPPEFRSKLQGALAEAKTVQARGERPGSLASVEQELTELHAGAVYSFLTKEAIDPSYIDIIGFHGQTVLHRPEAGLTVQLGNGELLAKLLGIDVVYDMRAADVAAGGQGAPLVPLYHQALAAAQTERPIAILNLGGVANVTWIGADGKIVAFDTGPGNAMIDDWVREHTGEPWDEAGKHAAAGRMDDSAIAHLLSNPYFAAPPPKSLDRNAFDRSRVGHLSLEDGAATLTAFTAAAVSKAAAHFPEPAKIWIVSGGGSRNLTLMAMLEKVLGAQMIAAETLGLNGDSLEAEAWAYLAVRSLKGLPITYPMTTGAPNPMTGGVLAQGKR